ncbi:hypothetical protein K435DRAFT_874533 [Dendrothele bispora CBS 962.96]|uniref:Uncharacterized protein n=1 Tax=Dendrothele bispora (strain CBS 962.96) TaxID=1314807 RepID=A0A4S8KWH9_DENBC|nr:hypothetical protein K435DRAFT_874533 [Dendrothele bispora CBS 962.96]
MPGPVFNEKQLNVLQHEFLPGYTACSTNTLKNSYLKSIIEPILNHAEFKNKLDPNLKTEAQWKDSIKNWFTNKRDKEVRHKLKKLAGGSTTNADTNVNATSLSNGSGRVHDKVACIKTMRNFVRLVQIIRNGRIDDGEAVFRSSNRDRIEAHAKIIEGETEEAKFKKASKELWAAQNDSAKALFEEQAKASWDITRNQNEFLTGVVALMDSLCQYGHLGKMELLLSYNLVQEGVLVSGSFSAHSDPDIIPDFENEYPEAFQQFEQAWTEYGLASIFFQFQHPTHPQPHLKYPSIPILGHVFLLST